MKSRLWILTGLSEGNLVEIEHYILSEVCQDSKIESTQNLSSNETFNVEQTSELVAGDLGPSGSKLDVETGTAHEIKSAVQGSPSKKTSLKTQVTSADDDSDYADSGDCGK